MRIDAIVLAGGAATRFGGDKLAAVIDGETVLGRSVAMARRLGDRVVVVVGPGDPDPGLDGVTLARDAVAHRGPLAGLLTGLEALPGADLVLVVAGDMPEASPAVLGLLLGALHGDASLAVAHLESEPVATLPFAARAATVLPAARRLLDADRRSLRALLDTVPAMVVPAAEWRALDPDGRTLVDIDTPGDLPRG